MRYFKIKIKGLYTEEGRIASVANGEFVPDSDMLFSKIRHGEIITNTPVFDYFHLQSFDKKDFWEWQLFDAHSGGWEYPGNNNWYISDKLKMLLENQKIAPKYHFYETKLLYDGEKLKYWIFQFPIESFQNIDFVRSEFKFNQDSKIHNFKSEEEFLLFYRKEYRETKRELRTIKVCLKDNFDIVYTINNNIVVSKQFKNAIEENGIEGFEFSELDYEVIVKN
jgi:hypothetical protein